MPLDTPTGQCVGAKLAGGDPAGEDWKKSLLIDMSFGEFLEFILPTQQIRVSDLMDVVTLFQP